MDEMMMMVKLKAVAPPLSIDARLKLSSGMIICGPSQGGKSMWCKHLIKCANEVYDTPISKVYWYYGAIWSSHLLAFKDDANVFIRQGIPEDRAEIDPYSLIVIDDNIKADLSEIFSTWTHHIPCGAIKITQNIYHKKTDRTTNICAQYLVLFKYPGDKMIIKTLASQMRKPWLTAAYDHAMIKPYSYLLIDLHQQTPESIRIRTNILPGEGLLTVYKEKR